MQSAPYKDYNAEQILNYCDIKPSTMKTTFLSNFSFLQAFFNYKFLIKQRETVN